MLSKLIKMVNWRVLVFLIRMESSLSGIARETRTTKANTFHSLKELEKLDMVRKTVSGRTHVYRFNFLHPEARFILDMAVEEERLSYSQKLKNLPVIIHTFLSHSLKEIYQGCIFFGSSLEAGYRDIDIFIALKKRENTQEIEKKLKLMDSRISPIFGSEEELNLGVENQDMLYNNILLGVPFGLDTIGIRCKDMFLRKKDIKERFIMGYRDVLGCMEFTEREYREPHLERGVMDFLYAVLHYLDMFPKNDSEAVRLFRQKLKESKPKTVKEAIRVMEKYAWIL